MEFYLLAACFFSTALRFTTIDVVIILPFSVLWRVSTPGGTRNEKVIDTFLSYSVRSTVYTLQSTVSVTTIRRADYTVKLTPYT